MVFVWAVVQGAKGNRLINAFAQLDEQQGKLLSPLREVIGVTVRDAFDKAVQADFAQAVTDLV